MNIMTEVCRYSWDFMTICIYIYIIKVFRTPQHISAPSSLCFNRTHWKKGLEKGHQRASYEQIKHPIESLDLVSSNSDSCPNWNIPNGSKPMVHSSSLSYHIWIILNICGVLGDLGTTTSMISCNRPSRPNDKQSTARAPQQKQSPLRLPHIHVHMFQYVFISGSKSFTGTSAIFGWL